MINRADMLDEFVDTFGLVDDPIPETSWSMWLGVWSMAWTQAERALLKGLEMELKVKLPERAYAKTDE